MSGVLVSGIIAFLSMFVPGALLALALLYRKTELHIIEILIIGFIFGLIAPASLTWIESYIASSIHSFSFSLGLFEANALALTIAGLVLCYWQGVFKEFSFKGMTRSQIISSEQSQIGAMERNVRKSLDSTRSELAFFEDAKELIARHKQEEYDLKKKHNEEQKLVSQLDANDRVKLAELHKQEEAKLMEKHETEESLLLSRLKGKERSATGQSFFNIKTSWVWIALLFLIIITFATRILGIGPSPQFFEFDPYFDMLGAESILVFGHQYYTSPSAWPAIPGGSVMRIQPLVPYIEAYWYSLANSLGPHHTTFSTSLMSYVGSVYPPITAALLVFAIFMLLYHEYGKYVGLIGAALTASMPVLFTTFVSGEQLVEPWGIFSLFFFFATYMFAVRNMKSTRLAVLAGIAFASTFLGAHYYSVDTAVLSAYILIQGVVSILRRDISWDFYKMNIIVIIVIGIFLAAYAPYNATSGGTIPAVLGMPITLAGPVLALLVIAIMEYIPKLLHQRKIVFKNLNFKTYFAWMIIVVLLAIAVAVATPLRKTIVSFINLGAHYTTPSIPLFMTVQEYVPTGLGYNFGASGFGLLGAAIGNVPISVWLICFGAIILILISIFYRKSKTGIFYLAIAGPLMFAGFSEVKYLPHFGVVFIMFFCIIIGELLLIADKDYDLRKYGKELSQNEVLRPEYQNAFQKHSNAVYILLSIGLFFISPIISVIFLIAVIALKLSKQGNTYIVAFLIIILLIQIAAVIVNHSLMMGEGGSILEAFGAAATYSANPATACTIISNHGNSIGADMFCNTVPEYWIEATAWMKENIGPSGPRILAWWDYGDWINWFGNSNAVLRGDNSDAKEDYAAAANFVLGPEDNYTPQKLVNFMNTNQTAYLAFDEDLVGKWQALDFLACIDVNQTSTTFAIAQGAAQSPPVPYALGNSQCELEHDPQFALVPYAALTGNSSIQQSIAYYCTGSNSTAPLIKVYLVNGDSIANQTVCMDAIPNSNGVWTLFDSNGTKTNAVIQSSFYEGIVGISGVPFVEYLMIYLPNSNGTVTNPPSQFYNSNYYLGFFLGDLPGMHLVYPLNDTSGVNFVNSTNPIRIFELDNFTGQLPQVPQKPSYVHNNYTMP